MRQNKCSIAPASLSLSSTLPFLSCFMSSSPSSLFASSLVLLSPSFLLVYCPLSYLLDLQLLFLFFFLSLLFLFLLFFFLIILFVPVIDGIEMIVACAVLCISIDLLMWCFFRLLLYRFLSVHICSAFFCLCFFLCTHSAHSSLSISVWPVVRPPLNHCLLFGLHSSVCPAALVRLLYGQRHCSAGCPIAAAPKLFCRLCDCPVPLVVAACSAACPDVAQASILPIFGSLRFSAHPARPGFVTVPRLSGFWFILDVVLAVWFLHYHCCSARPVVWPSNYLCPVDLFSVLSVRSVSGVSRHVFSALFVFQVVVGVFVTVAILVVCSLAAVYHPAHSGWFVWFGRISIHISLFFLCATVVSSYWSCPGLIV